MATRRKEYRFRNGKIIEIEENHDGNYGAPGQKRIKKKKPTEEQMRLVNINNKVRDAGISCWNISMLAIALVHGRIVRQTDHLI